MLKRFIALFIIVSFILSYYQKFDPAQLSELEQSDFKGFTPVITGFRYIQSPFPLLGINAPAKKTEV